MEAALAAGVALPEWAVEDDLAARCRLTLAAYHRWCWRGEGTYQVARLRVKWTIDDLAAEDAQRRQVTPDAFGGQNVQWLGGGEADPHDSAIFEDELEVA